MSKSKDKIIDFKFKGYSCDSCKYAVGFNYCQYMLYQIKQAIWALDVMKDMKEEIIKYVEVSYVDYMLERKEENICEYYEQKN